jgi:DNA-binding NarL/FixJ family response regulator
MAGDIRISPQITVRLLRRLAATQKLAPGSGDHVTLTEREVDAARGVRAGKTNAEIGAELFVSAGTVKTHIANIQAKLGTRNRVGIAAWAWVNGYIQLG